MRVAAAAGLLLLCLLCPGSLSAHSGEADSPIGFAERLGSFADLDATFTDETGKEASLRSYAGKPVLLILGYYRCKDLCSTLVVNAAKAIAELPGQPGKDWQVVMASINPDETTRDALAEKAVALTTAGKAFPPEGWRFLVGTHESIDRLGDSVGFSYRKEGVDYDHPLGIVMLSPEGRIVRYIIGPDFLPVDLNMSVLEASAGLVRPTVAKLLRFCLSYDPNRNQFAFNFLRVTSLVTTFLVLLLALVLVVAGRRRRAARAAVEAASGGDADGRGQGPSLP